MSNTIRLEGDTNWQRDGVERDYHREVLTIDYDRVEARIAGHGDDCPTTDPVVSTDRAVVEYELRKIEARRVTAYRNRHVTPIFKPERKRRKN